MHTFLLILQTMECSPLSVRYGAIEMTATIITIIASLAHTPVWVLLLDPLVELRGVQLNSSPGSATRLDGCDGLGSLHDLNQPHVLARGQAAVGDHPVAPQYTGAHGIKQS